MQMMIFQIFHCVFTSEVQNRLIVGENAVQKVVFATHFAKRTKFVVEKTMHRIQIFARMQIYLATIITAVQEEVYFA